MHALLSEINFQDPKKKFENIEKEPSVVTPPAPKYPKLHQINEPTKEKKETFFSQLGKTGQDIAI